MPIIQGIAAVISTSIASATIGSKLDKIRQFVVVLVDTLSFLFIGFAPDRLIHTVGFKGSHNRLERNFEYASYVIIASTKLIQQ